MIIQYHKRFEKRFRILRPDIQKKVIIAIQHFGNNPHNPVLRNHPLKGRLSGLRAFSVTGDVRVIFQEYQKYTIVLMVDVGTHNQVYD